MLSSNLTQEDLIKVYNLILYKFSTELTELGFETLENQEIDFKTNVKDADQINGASSVTEDIMAIVSLLGPNAGNQSLSKPSI